MRPENPSTLRTGPDTLMKRLVAHSSSPYRVSQIIEVLRAISFPAADREEIEKQLAAITGRRYCCLTTSGRYSLYLVLKALPELSLRKNVIVPSYTCPSVINAIDRSGLTPVFCDLQSGRFDYDFLQLRKLITDETAAVVAVNLCGQICNFEELNNITREKNVVLIEDACQSLGGSYRKKPSGGLGTFSIVSFGFSKNMAMGSGGAVLTDDADYHRIIQKHINPAAPGSIRQILFLAKWFAYLILMRPRLYYLLRLLPHSFEDENFDFKLKEEGRMPGYQARLLSSLLGDLSKLTENRRSNARLLYRVLSGLPGIQLFSNTVTEGNAALRFPFLAQTTTQRTRLIARLRKVGIEADPFYDLNQQRFFREIKGASPVSSGYTERIVTIPTHGYLKHRDIGIILDSIASEGNA